MSDKQNVAPQVQPIDDKALDQVAGGGKMTSLPDDRGNSDSDHKGWIIIESISQSTPKS